MAHPTIRNLRNNAAVMEKAARKRVWTLRYATPSVREEIRRKLGLPEIEEYPTLADALEGHPDMVPGP